MRKLFSTNPLQPDLGLLLLRLVSGLLMAFGHGLGKVEKFLSGEEITFYNFGGIGPQASLGLAAFAEFVCALLVVLGLFHRAALIPLIITMAVAAFGAHADDLFGKGEAALMFLAVFIALFLTGPGRFSLDRFVFDGDAR
jgi:putative oxidoreductase